MNSIDRHNRYSPATGDIQPEVTIPGVEALGPVPVNLFRARIRNGESSKEVS